MPADRYDWKGSLDKNKLMAVLHRTTKDISLSSTSKRNVYQKLTQPFLTELGIQRVKHKWDIMCRFTGLYSLLTACFRLAKNVISPHTHAHAHTHPLTHTHKDRKRGRKHPNKRHLPFFQHLTLFLLSLSEWRTVGVLVCFKAWTCQRQNGGFNARPPVSFILALSLLP